MQANFRRTFKVSVTNGFLRLFLNNSICRTGIVMIKSVCIDSNRCDRHVCGGGSDGFISPAGPEALLSFHPVEHIAVRHCIKRSGTRHRSKLFAHLQSIQLLIYLPKNYD